MHRTRPLPAIDTNVFHHHRTKAGQIVKPETADNNKSREVRKLVAAIEQVGTVEQQALGIHTVLLKKKKDIGFARGLTAASTKDLTKAIAWNAVNMPIPKTTFRVASGLPQKRTTDPVTKR
jgi:ATP phosphoribosyltransferase